MNESSDFSISDYKIVEVPGELFLLVVSTSEEQEEALYAPFLDEINQSKEAARLRAQDNDEPVTLMHMLSDIGESRTHTVILDIWLFANKGEDAGAIPFVFLVEPHKRDEAIARLRAIWEECTEGKNFCHPRGSRITGTICRFAPGGSLWTAARTKKDF
jgi:hypothetical protein